MASAIVMAPSSVRARSARSKLPATARLPRYVEPKRSPSSSAKVMTSKANGSCVWPPYRGCTAAMATTTPSGPSHFPASRTVARGEPNMTVELPAGVLSYRPRRLPMLSRRTTMPASRIHASTWSLARRIALPAKYLVRRSGSSLKAPRMSQRSIAASADEFPIRRSAAAAFLERDVLRPLPHDAVPQRGELVVALVDRCEVVAAQLAGLAREHRRAVRKQDFGLAQPAWIKQQMSGRRVAGVVLVAEVQVEVAEGDPSRLAAPPRLDDLRLERQHGAKPGAGFGRELGFESCDKTQVGDD